tara:strand:- start:43 stop:540 length:498 start_codon:yes stop_codon:yes gene_type:complete
MMEYARVYKLTNHLGEVYIGSTRQKYLSNRLASHRYSYLNRTEKPSDGCRQRYSSHILFDNADSLDEVKISLLENVEANDVYELQNRERHYIQNTDCVNQVIPTRTPKEWYDANAKDLNEKKKKNMVKCECGNIVRADCLARHKKTLCHTINMKPKPTFTTIQNN